MLRCGRRRAVVDEIISDGTARSRVVYMDSDMIVADLEFTFQDWARGRGVYNVKRQTQQTGRKSESQDSGIVIQYPELEETLLGASPTSGCDVNKDCCCTDAVDAGCVACPDPLTAHTLLVSLVRFWLGVCLHGGVWLWRGVDGGLLFNLINKPPSRPRPRSAMANARGVGPESPKGSTAS